MKLFSEMQKNHDAMFSADPRFQIKGGGITGELFRSIDWDNHPLGSTESWPNALKISLHMLFASQFPMLVWWGPQFYQFYNDECLPSFGTDKHPAAMGQAGKDCWPESWDLAVPQLKEVITSGMGSSSQNIARPLIRDGKLSEAHWTYSYSPIFNDDRSVGGVFAVGFESTGVVALSKSQQEKDSAERARRAAESIKLAVENERENLRNLFEESPEMVCITSGPEHIFEFVNGSHVRALGFNATGMSLREAQPESVEVHGIMDEVYRTGVAAKISELSVTLTDRRRFFNITYAARRAASGQINGIMILALEVSDQVTAREALSIQKRALELTLDSAPLESILTALVETAEMQSGNSSIGSICLLDEKELYLHFAAGPSLPKSFLGPGDFFKIGPEAGSCGTAAYIETATLVTDVTTDSRWVTIKEKAAEHGIKACWSTPIISSQGKVLGTFALYFKTCRGPTSSEAQVVELVTRTAALVIERKTAQKDLVKARDLAETASATKSSFLANMSHEIRTPLGAIMGFVNLIRQSKNLSPEINKYTAIISRNSAQLLGIIDDILDLSKVEAGKMTIESEDFSLPHLLLDFGVLMAPRAEESAIGFKILAPNKIPDFITSDPIRLRQILTNVVGNAIKFTEKGQVEVIVTYDDHFLEIKVKDSGRGISPDQARNLFQPFTQADVSTTRKYGGTGLGLVLTKRLASALGGDFWLESSTVGEGSVFVAAIKVALPPYAKMVGQSALVQLSETSENIRSDSNELDGMKILLVEDSPDNQALLHLLLSKAGAKTTICNDGKQGMQQALSSHYDVVLMDVQMPVMDGHEATSRLRAHGYHKPIVALTAHAMREERQRSVVSGFTDYITKPIHREELIETLVKHGR